MRELFGRSSAPVWRRWRNLNWWPVALTAGLVVALTVGSTSAAVYTDATASVTNSLALDTLDPPTALVATGNGTGADLTWTPTVDTYADGYRILRSETSGSGHAAIDTVAGQATSSYTDTWCGVEPAEPRLAAMEYQEGNGTTATVLIPGGVAVDDLLLAHVVVDGADTTISPPAGWTQIYKVNSSSGVNGALYYRVADGTEASSFNFGLGASRYHIGAIFRYEGVDPVSPIEASASAVGVGTSMTAPSVTTVSSGAKVVRFGAADYLPFQLDVFPSGTQNHFLHEFYVSSALVDAVQTTPGSSGTATFTINSEQWAAGTVALKPGTASNCGIQLMESTQTLLDGNGVSINASVPAGTVADDLLIAQVIVYRSTTINTPTGWTPVFQNSYGAQTMRVFYRVADGTEPSTYSFTWSGLDEAVVGMARYDGVDTSNPIGPYASTTDYTATPQLPSIVTTVDGSVLFRVFSAIGWRGGNTNFFPSGHVGRWGLQAESTWGMADQKRATAGSTGAGSFTLSSSYYTVSGTVAINPASAGTYYYVLESTSGGWSSAQSNESP